MRLTQLRKRKTFFRFHKSNQLLYYYPLRDTTNNGVMAVLAEYGFENMQSSGCSPCPVFVVMDNKMKKKDERTNTRSYNLAEKLGIVIDDHVQTKLEDYEFCSGG